MIERIIEFSARNRLLVVGICLALALMGWWSLATMPLDAIPDLTDTQVILYTKWDRSPDLVEAQITYPIVTALMGAPKVRTVRGFSDFGYSYVYVIYEDGADLYWARSRTLEYLSAILPGLPQGAKTELGPDATGLGWIYQYALVDESGRHNLAELRSVQDWYLRFHLKAVPGVAEVAPIGGFGKQYQVRLDPNRLRALNIPVNRVVEAVRASNAESGGRLIEFGGAEYMVRGRGFLKSIEDLENAAIVTSEAGPSIRVKDVGAVTLGPDLRRGVADLDGNGETVSGIVVMRNGENALQVIDAVKAKLRQIEPGLPRGVRIVPVYDRSELIRRAVDHLKTSIAEIVLTVTAMIFLFLWHVPSALIPVFTIPIAVLIAFVPFRGMDLTANIMSLGGIAIAIGAMDDASIVVVEQTHKKLELWQRLGGRGNPVDVVIQAIKEVGRPSYYALLVIAVSFLPILALEAQEGRLFKPLAYTKNLTMLMAAVLAITLDPALRLLFLQFRSFSFRPLWLSRVANTVFVGRIRPEEHHPVSRALVRGYTPVVRWSLANKGLVVGCAALLVLATVPVWFALGSEFMPPLDEGSVLYMPSTMPGISAGEARRLLQATDRVLKGFPEVEHVLGKAGRAETATDPAPLSMIETVITLKPQEKWRRREVWYTKWAPQWLLPVLRHFYPDHIRTEDLIDEMNAALRVPGLSNAWTMPVKGRIEMLSTGIRTPLGIKVTGDRPETLARLGSEVERALKPVAGARSVFAERTAGGYFVDIDWSREKLAAHGLTMEEAQVAVQSAIGGETVTTVIDGLARYSVNVRLQEAFRDDVDSLRTIPVPCFGGFKMAPLGDLAEVRFATGPSMLRNENGLLTSYVYVDLAGRDPASFIEEADRVLRDIRLPAGFSLHWSGQYESMARVRERLKIVLPLTLALIVLLLYANTRSAMKTAIVLLAVPFSAVGAIWFLYVLGYSMSVGVWAGLIALLGVDAETGVFMLLYLDLAYEGARREGKMRSKADLETAIVAGAAHRLRPKFMTLATTWLGLIPILWSTGAGADVMKRIAAPMVGGILTSFLLELVVYPALYAIWKWRTEVRHLAVESPAVAVEPVSVN